MVHPTLQHCNDVVHVVGDIIHVCRPCPSIPHTQNISILKSLFQLRLTRYENKLILTFPVLQSIRTKPMVSSSSMRHSTHLTSKTIAFCQFFPSKLILIQTNTEQRSRSPPIIHMFPLKGSWKRLKQTRMAMLLHFMSPLTTLTSLVEPPFHCQVHGIQVLCFIQSLYQYSTHSYSVRHPIPFFAIQIQLQCCLSRLIHRTVHARPTFGHASLRNWCTD